MTLEFSLTLVMWLTTPNGRGITDLVPWIAQGGISSMSLLCHEQWWHCLLGWPTQITIRTARRNIAFKFGDLEDRSCWRSATHAGDATPMMSTWLTQFSQCLTIRTRAALEWTGTLLTATRTHQEESNKIAKISVFVESSCAKFRSYFILIPPSHPERISDRI